MPAPRQLHLGAFMRPVSIHTGAWRYPGACPDANFNFAHYIRFIRRLEEGKFDAFFMADHLALLNMPIEALRAATPSRSFDPLTLLPALAAVTERIGLIATASTTYNDPYHVARKFASLDHISGRARGLEPGDHGQPRRGAEFRPGRAHGAWRTLQARPRVLRRGHRPVGQLRRRRLHPRRRQRHLLRPGQDACAEPQGRGIVGARPAQRGAAGAGLAGHRAGRRVGCRAPDRRRDGRDGLRRRRPDRRCAGLLRRCEGPRGARSGATRTTSRSCPARWWWSATRSRRRGRSAPISTAWCITTAPSRSLSIALGVDARAFDPDGPLPEIPETERTARAAASAPSPSRGARA